jgi:outer membrane cobalamin receptor
MRVLVGIFLILSLTAVAVAADLKVKVVDPSSAAVSGAQTLLVRVNDSKILSTQTTSAEGQAVFRLPEAGSCQIKVLAPGFAPETVDVSSQSELTVKLRLAPSSETVVVSATRTPVPGEAAGADFDTLSGAQLTTMQPVTANDALRFLPGAVINTAGQRGGLSSLFVRGGESNYNKVIVDGVTINEPGGTFDFGTLSLAQGDRMEFVRGAQSTLYGSDAMTSLIQVWTRAGNTPTPELLIGADGGNFSTASGHAS